MEYKITAHRNLTSLEFELLEEATKLRVLNSLITDDESEEKRVLFRNIKRRLDDVVKIGNIFEVICKIDSGFICVAPLSHKPYLLIRDCPNLEVGGMYFSAERRYAEDIDIVKINKELTDDKKVEELFNKMDKWVEEADFDDWMRNPRRYSSVLVQTSDINGKEINLEVISKRFEEYKAEREAAEKEKLEEEITEEEEKVKKEDNQKVIYNSKGKIEFAKAHITGKTIKDIINNNKYTLNKNVNKIFSYEDINSKELSAQKDTILTNVEIFLNNHKVSYVKKRHDGKTYKVEYINKKCKINEVSIPSAKINFVLNKIFIKGGTKDEIKVLAKLNGMKMDFIGLEKLRWGNTSSINIPIVNKVIDDKTFETEFLGRKKIFDWDIIKRLFFDGGGSRTAKHWHSNESLLEFSEEMGATKKELFATIKRIKILNSLKSEDDD